VIPGQQFVEAVGRVIGDAADDVAQAGFGVEAVQAVDGSFQSTIWWACTPCRGAT
jgi:hypothetical protein